MREDRHSLLSPLVEIGPWAPFQLAIETLHRASCALRLQNIAHLDPFFGSLETGGHPSNQTAVQHLDFRAFLLNFNDTHVPEDLFAFFACFNHTATQDLETVAVVALPHRQGGGITIFLNVPPLTLHAVPHCLIMACHR